MPLDDELHLPADDTDGQETLRPDGLNVTETPEFFHPQKLRREPVIQIRLRLLVERQIGRGHPRAEERGLAW
ncbi:hypothetical protein C8Q76DRAFT_725832, partial [Earliella scabrosa]